MPALLCAALLGGVVYWSLRSSEPAGGPAGRLPGDVLDGALAAQVPAGDPLAGFGEARVALGDRCMRIAVADEPGERVQGLRGVTDLGAYDGMLFVFPTDGRGAFTMAGTPRELDIGFYDAGGREVDRERMTPCPEGDDASCPLYESRARYRYALETAAGGLGSGVLSACG
ncbi:MAG: DUF192 domain-containing protein [Acidimicrobiia bacterium]|nr:DUF192 domain-containing protein [Acidimicrobiia bacterium]